MEPFAQDILLLTGWTVTPAATCHNWFFHLSPLQDLKNTDSRNGRCPCIHSRSFLRPWSRRLLKLGSQDPKPGFQISPQLPSYKAPGAPAQTYTSKQLDMRAGAYRQSQVRASRRKSWEWHDPEGEVLNFCRLPEHGELDAVPPLPLFCCL